VSVAERFAIVMAGGSGTRFWPASRADKPKQFLQLAGARESLLQGTVRRASAIVGADRVLVVTNARHEAATREQLPALPRDNLLLEPAARNTAPCIAWASAIVHERDRNAVLAVLPADSYIADEAAFGAVVERALAAAQSGSLVTIGVTPTRPETGYGYVEAGEAVSHGVMRVKAFVEKPDHARAESYVSSGRHLWNSGMFFFRADVMLAALERCLPELGAFVVQLSASTEPAARAELIARAFPSLPSISIDYGVMERERDIAVVPGAFGWDDVGSFSAAWQLADKDAQHNAARGDALFEDSTGCYASAPDGKLVALLGVRDLVVVDTPDAVLVMPRERAQDVRKIIDALKASGRARHL
jgi:mannose-1-phosphate guanylyltransferase